MKYLTFRDSENFDEYLFDLASDPGEKLNLFDSRAEEADRLEKILSAWETKVEADW